MAICSICKGGVPFKKEMSNKTIDIPIGTTTVSLTCATLEAALPLIVSSEKEEDCYLVQTLGLSCGCPIEDNACTLCSDSTQMYYPNNVLPFLEEQFGFIPTCSLVNAFLSVQSVVEDSMCSISQELLGDYCGCKGTKISKGCSFCPDGQVVPLPNKELNISGLPIKTCGQLESALQLVVEDGQEMCTTFQKFSSYCGCNVAENACEMCPHGEILFQDKDLSFVIGNAGIDSLVPTCKIFEAFGRSTLLGSDECVLVPLMGGYCGCPPINDHCTLCRGQNIPDEFQSVYLHPEILRKFPLLEDVTSLTCGDAESCLSQIDKDSMMCYTSQFRGDLCGCFEGGFGYFGTEEHPERRPAFPWIPRFSALLSIISVTLIMLDVLRDKKKKENVYCRLMLGMAAFDFFSSFAWLVNAAAIPFDIVEPIYGASGNEATCKAQCFFLQLAIGSIFYNVSLSTYYYMVVIMSKREKWLKGQEWWLHGIPIAVGLSVSFASIPFASNNYYGCHIPLSPKEFDWASYGLYVFPVGFVLLYCTTLTLRICWRVARQKSVASKWRFPSHGKLSHSKPTSETLTGLSSQAFTQRKKKKIGSFDTLQNRVIWQSTFYLGAFWCTWPLFVLAFVASDAVDSLPQTVKYTYFVISLALVPLQGFLNGILYFRTRLSRIIYNKKQKTKRGEMKPFWSRCLSSNGSFRFWKKVIFLPWNFRNGDDTNNNDIIGNNPRTNESPSQDICDIKMQGKSSTKIDQSMSAHDVIYSDSSFNRSNALNSNMHDERSNSVLGNDNSISSNLPMTDETEINDTDPSILLAAMDPMNESEDNYIMDLSQLSGIDEEKESSY